MAQSNTSIQTTNATNTGLASEIDGLPKGRFVGLIYTKKGKLVGRGAARQRYGDDEVHAVLFVGFKYGRLVQRSKDKALRIGAKGILAECQRRGITGKSGAPITLADCTKALDDFIASCDRSLNGTNESTTDHVYEALTVNGEAVRGARVYTGPGNPSDPKAPVPGTIYLQGLLIGQKVLTPAANGPIPASNSRGDVVAKGVLRGMTPLGRYRSYALDGTTGALLRHGQGAIVRAANAGVTASSGAASTVNGLLTDEDE
jgi:hypothetical protein